MSRIEADTAAQLRSTGLVGDARWCPSPNFGERPAGKAISLLVVHNISLPPGEFGGEWIEQFFCNQLNPADHPYFACIAPLKVSSHLLIRRDGELVQFVNLCDRAWHAGRSCFAGEEECNDYSIGIELEGTDTGPYTQAQYQTLADVSTRIIQAWPAISDDRITGHSDIAPGRKTDPGPGFDWSQFRRLLADYQSAGLQPDSGDF